MGAWLNYKTIKFKYEPGVFTLTKSMRYTPDFLLEEVNEYVEVKGLDPKKSNQPKKRELFMKDHVLHLLKWKELRDTCGLTLKSYDSYLYRAKKNGIAVNDYIANLFISGNQ